MRRVESNKSIDNFGWSPKGVTLKSGSRESWDDAITGYPIAPNGYNDFFALATERTAVLTGVTDWEIDIEQSKARPSASADWVKYDIVINTISLDHLCQYSFGELKYIGRDLELFVLPVKEAFPKIFSFCIIHEVKIIRALLNTKN